MNRFTETLARVRALFNTGTGDGLGRNALWLLGDLFVRTLVGLLLHACIARHLGPAAYGELSVAIVLVLLFAPLGDLGIVGITTRNLARNPSEARPLLGTSFCLRFAGGCLGAMLAQLAARFTPGMPEGNATLVGLVSFILIFQSTDVVDAWFQSQGRNFAPICAKACGLVTQVSISLWMLKTGSGPVGFALGIFAEWLVNAIALLILSKWGTPVTTWRFQKAHAVSLLRDGWPLFAAGWLRTLYLRLDQLLLATMMGTGAVGIFAVASRLIDGALGFPVVMHRCLVPSVMAAATSLSPEEFRGRIFRVYQSFACVGYGLAIGLSLLAWPLTHLLFGPGYESSASVIAVMAWCVFFSSLGVARGLHLIAINETGPHALTNLLGIATNLSLNLVMIPRLGAVGAAIAALVSHAMTAYFACLFIPRLRPVFRLMTRALFDPRFWRVARPI